MFCIFHLDFARFKSYNICTVAIKNTRNIHAVSTNQIANVLRFNGKETEKNLSLGLNYKSFIKKLI